jgi:hypothetical protein
MSTGSTPVEPSSNRAAREDSAEKRATPTEEHERHTAPDETELFPPSGETSYFGTGSYSTGGWNLARGDINPRGGYGSFTDAGGFGATRLYGEEEEAETSSADESPTVAADKPEEHVPGTTADAATAPNDRHQLIARAAYYLAERRGYESGHELDDWLAAEREVDRGMGAPGVG